MKKILKIIGVFLIISVIAVIVLYVDFINAQAKDGSLLIEKGSFADFLILDKTGMHYYNPKTGGFDK